jgi:mRNA interferase MazF
MYEQRDIVLIPFPYSDLTVAKQRPALILSNNLLNETQDMICCLITSNPIKDGIELKNNLFENGKLPFKSWIKPQRLFTINNRIITKKLCKIKEEMHHRVIKNLIEYLKI